MSLLTLPAGKSLREIAHILGVPLEDLQSHTDISDPERPLPETKQVEVPDGFLRARAKAAQHQAAAINPTGRAGGMNAFLALDIEQKRTRIAGGMHTSKKDTGDIEALEELRRTFQRFEDDSNELTIDLAKQLNATQSTEVRAEAFEILALGYGFRWHLFGRLEGDAKAHALSAAKSAVTANPKSARAKTAMALALSVGGNQADLDEALKDLDALLLAHPLFPEALTERAYLLLRMGNAVRAKEAAQIATEELEHIWPRTHEILGRALMELGEEDAAKEAFEKARSVASYANASAFMALMSERAGLDDEAKKYTDEARERATSDAHERLLDGILRGESPEDYERVASATGPKEELDAEFKKRSVLPKQR